MTTAIRGNLGVELVGSVGQCPRHGDAGDGGLHQPALFQAEEVVLGDDDVVEDLDAEDLTGLA